MESASTSPRHRCPTCELSASVRPRNLVVFIDGTSNKPGDKNTNVVKLFYNVMVTRPEDSELEQRKYFLGGIGAYDVDHLSRLERAGNTVYREFEKALAWNTEKNVKSAYNWLAECYQKGDQIYLFGFSRGAHQVHALASMIHEVGLVKWKEHSEAAYDRYLAIDPYEPESRNEAIQFKKRFCWQGVRIHFIGVWDTVASSNPPKNENAFYVPASESVTNACHLRHALALDECRPDFVPVYFSEMNAHHSAGSPRSAISDVKEVWFAGSHFDIGGTERSLHGALLADSEDDDLGPYAVHAGNVPLVWMQREAADKGLVFKSKGFAWDPEDIGFGRRDALTSRWSLVQSRPRLVIPGQQIHVSVLSSNQYYTPRATLAGGICIPTASVMPPGELWTTELADEEATTRLLSLLLRDPQVALRFVEKTLFLLDSRLGRGQNVSIPQPRWSKEDILMRSDFTKFALTVIYDATSNFTAAEDLVISARASLSTVLSTPDHPDFYRTMCALRFSARHDTLRQRFIDHDEVIGALMHALEWTAKSTTTHLFLPIMDTLCSIVENSDLRSRVVNQLSSNATGTTKPRFSVALEVKSPNQLVASLKMVASLPRIEPGGSYQLPTTGPWVALRPRIHELAVKRNSLVGSVAVEASVKLNVQLTPDVPFPNILGYLSNILPRLDVEGGVSSADNVDGLPLVPGVNGFGPLDEEVMGKLVSSIQSGKAHERTAATLTLLKLCGNSAVREACPDYNILDIFMRQMEHKGTSLLAAYALMICWKYNMWTSAYFRRGAQRIITMLDKGWFDDAVGRVEGCEIFRGLMASDELRTRVLDLGIVTMLFEKLESGECDKVRMGLLCLDILGMEDPLDLVPIVAESVNRLRDKDIKVQEKGVNALAALAQTAAGEGAIMPHVMGIMRMLLSLSPLSEVRSKSLGPAFALIELAKNENLRMQIQSLPEYREFRSQLHTLHSRAS